MARAKRAAPAKTARERATKDGESSPKGKQGPSTSPDRSRESATTIGAVTVVTRGCPTSA